MKNRVAITGIGVNVGAISTIIGFAGLISDQKQGENCNKNDGEIRCFKNRKIKKLLSRGEKYFCSSACKSIDDSQILDSNVAPHKRGVFLGTTKESSSREELLEVLKSIYGKDIDKHSFPKAVSENMSPLFVVKSLPNACLHYTAEEFEIRGNNTLFITNGVASSQAIAESANTISRGDCIWALAGGFDSHIDEGEFYNFEQYGLKVQIEENERKSHLLGEGAGCLVLEEYDHAVTRGAKIYGEIISHSETYLDCDCEIVECIDILKNAILKSLDEGKIKSNEIDFINIDGSPNALFNDLEKKAIRSIFSDIPVVDIKSKIGNLIGAASVVEIIADLMILNGLVETVYHDCRICMKISYGFGGEVSILIIRRNES